MKKANAETWARFQEFMDGFIAARELHSRAAEKGCFVECVCLGASIVDAMLRVGIVLQYQLNNSSRDIPIEFIVQDPTDKMITEREIYEKAEAASVIDHTTHSKLDILYNDRNRVIHRYVISHITTNDVLRIATSYEEIIESLSQRIYEIEEEQISFGVGITVRGPSLKNEDGKDYLQGMADRKHGGHLGYCCEAADLS